MIKRVTILTVILTIMLMPAVIFAKANHQLATAAELTTAENLVTVPLQITNQESLVAADIPLKFSEGVTLKEVNFENTRVSYFDMKAAVIDNDKNTVVIGLLPQISSVQKPDLKAGTGTIANLVFEITDPTIAEISLEAIETRDPDHELMFVYHEFDENGVPSIVEVSPEFEGTVVSLAGHGADLPRAYSLSQNYPNPFNPTTNLSFDLPVASKVNLTIFNVLGQEVTTLVDKKMEAGSHTVEWNAARFSSGVYFYRISADNFTETKKMMILK